MRREGECGSARASRRAGRDDEARRRGGGGGGEGANRRRARTTTKSSTASCEISPAAISTLASFERDGRLARSRSAPRDGSVAGREVHGGRWLLGCEKVRAHEKGLFHFSRLSARGVAALKKRCRRERERKRQPRGRTRGNDCFKRTRSSEHFNDSTCDTRAAPTPVVAASRPPPRDPPRPSREAASHPNQPLTQPPRT